MAVVKRDRRDVFTKAAVGPSDQGGITLTVLGWDEDTRNLESFRPHPVSSAYCGEGQSTRPYPLARNQLHNRREATKKRLPSAIRRQIMGTFRDEQQRRANCEDGRLPDLL